MKIKEETADNRFFEPSALPIFDTPFSGAEKMNNENYKQSILNNFDFIHLFTVTINEQIVVQIDSCKYMYVHIYVHI